MFDIFEQICDAPPYHIVEALTQVDIERPMDVRWCRISHTVAPKTGWITKLIHKVLRYKSCLLKDKCYCGCRLPQIDIYRFTCTNNPESSVLYQLGQCPRCQTVFWDDYNG